MARRVFQIASMVFIVFSGFVIAHAWGFTYLTRIGPGPGFFPLWVGAILAGLSLILLAQVTFFAVEPLDPDFVPDRGGVVRLVSVVLGLVLFAVFLETVGFSISAFVLCFVLLYVLGGRGPFSSLVIAAAASFGVYYVFRIWLHVYLPAGPFDLIRQLGV